jgi:hypothetical protein
MLSLHLPLQPARFAIIFLVALASLAPAGSAAQNRVCGYRVDVPPDARARLTHFVERLGVKYPRATVGVIWTVHRTGRLPRCYLTKNQARRRGWRRGRSLWRVAHGHAIGGNRFGNRERLLPRGYRYVEADLDYDGRWRGGRRGARRLVFARSTKGQWRIWVTMDHYRRFHRVPAP